MGSQSSSGRKAGPVRSIPLETEEELQMIKQYILIPVLLDVLEQDIQAMETRSFKMGKVYVRALRHVQDILTEQGKALRQYFKHHGIRIYRQERTDQGLETEYICRGYHHQLSLLWSHVKSEVERALSEYLPTDFREGER